MGEGLKKWIKAFKALGDENRLKIVKLLLVRKELCVCELQALLRLSQPTISHHLRILEEAEFLKSRREGQWVIYQLNPKDEFKNHLIEIIDEALKENAEVASLLKEAKEINLRCP
ncbi:MAG: winged helix-turn-helix transcriptional regulator [Candidatus Desulfofervidaceae bacterium]|nr:winged helix-turn-helix transcriptional regulator [Candidatus Desulfofervidaceae bacterium]